MKMKTRYFTMNLIGFSAPGLTSHTILLEQAKVNRRQKALRQLASSADRRVEIAESLAGLNLPTAYKSSYSERLLQFTDR